MDWIFKKRRATLSIAAVSLVLMLASIMVRAFYTDGNFHPSIGWDILFLGICTCCFGAFSLWVFSKGFGPNSLCEKLTIRFLARIYFFVSSLIAFTTFVSLVVTVEGAVTW